MKSPNPQLFKNESGFDFNNTLNDMKSWKEFFIFLDAFIPLKWKMDFSVYPQVFCCRAQKTCSLPRLEKFIEETHFTTMDIQNIASGIDFGRSHFYRTATVDDVYAMTQHPYVDEFYREYGSRVVLSNIANWQVVDYQDLIIDRYGFKSIDDFKFSRDYITQDTLPLVFDALKRYNECVEIQAITIEENPDVDLSELREWAIGNNIIFDEITYNEFIHREDFYNRKFTLGEYNYWEEHIIYFYGGSFWLNKQQTSPASRQQKHLINRAPIYKVDGYVDAAAFLYGLAQRKIDLYASDVEHLPDGKQKEYMTWVGEHVIINPDFTFIPLSMLDRSVPYYHALVSDGWEETPYGLKRGDEIKSLVEVC